MTNEQVINATVVRRQHCLDVVGGIEMRNGLRLYVWRMFGEDGYPRRYI